MSLSYFTNKYIHTSIIDIVINNNKIRYNKTIELFENLFEPIFKLEPNDKLGIINVESYFDSKEYDLINSYNFNFVFFLDKYKLYQIISRWYYKQSRQIIFSKLDILFNEYFLLIDKLKLLEYNTCINYTEQNIKFTELNKKLIEKLEILKLTYNDEKIDIKINIYCEKLKINIIEIEKNEYEFKNNDYINESDDVYGIEYEDVYGYE